MHPEDDADPPPQRWDEYDPPGETPGSTVQPDAPAPPPVSIYPPSADPAPPADPPSSVDPPPSTWLPTSDPQPVVPYGSAGGSSTTGTFVTLGGAAGRIGSRWSLIGVIIGIAGATVGVGVAIWAATGGDGLGISNPLAKPDMHSQSGIDDLEKALRDEGVGTKVYDVTLYPDYAVVEVAVPGGNGRRYQGYYFNGSLDGDWSSGSKTTPEKTFDLAEIDGAALDGFCKEITTLVEDAGDCYVIVNPSETDSSLYSAYASNDYSEGGYISYNAAGKETSRNQW